MIPRFLISLGAESREDSGRRYNVTICTKRWKVAGEGNTVKRKGENNLVLRTEELGGSE